MTKITEIKNRSAASAWSPIREYADVIAIGAKDSGGAGFEETSSELELYDLQLSGGEAKLLGAVKTTSRFASLAWTPAGGPMGLIAGGMENGTIYIWDAHGITKGQETPLASFLQHASGPIKALQFNALHPLQLATGGSNGKVLIFHLDQLAEGGNPMVPCDSNQQQTQITAVAWNTQVGHIVASAAADGTVAVWDLKARKAWCELRAEPSGTAVADLAWNPTQGLHLLTASADDRNPLIKLWDLRTSTSMPLQTLVGHSQGILSIAWCPQDDHLLLSCGKDNRTILWDLFTLQPIADVPNDAPEQTTSTDGAQDTFAASGLASSQQRRYDVQWSPIKRGVASTCSLDRKVQAHSILGLSSKAGRPPKWMRPASSVSCGFGGAVVSCGTKDRLVTLRTVVEQPQLADLSNQFETTIASMPIIDYCQSRAHQATEPGEAQLWAFMQVIFETNARQQLLDTLGFDPDAIAQAAAAYSEAEVTSNGVESLSLQDKHASSMSHSTEEMVKRALLVGNFEAAVNICFRTNNTADALVLASCGGAELWAKAQERYFESQSSKRPFLSTVSAIIRNELGDLVQHSNPKHWPETLAILSTYGKSNEFPNLCIALGDLLENAGDPQSASLCYMCSLSLERAVRFWRGQLQQANKNGLDIVALHEFVVKVSVFLMAVGPSATLEMEDSNLFSIYASRLAEQGLLVAAAKYSKGDSEESKILRDRLYRSKASPNCLAAMGGVAPEFPFTFMDIQKSRGPTIDRVKQEAERKAAEAAQQAYAAQQQQAYAAQQQQQQQAAAAAAAASSSAYGQTAAAPVATSAVDALPPGWMELQDPASGRYYYANQTTGEVTWERPVSAVPAPQPAPAPAPTYQQQPEPAAYAPAATSNGKVSNNLASKYGDGFVTSSSHPELASQYGNVGTSNPYSTHSRPGTAQVSSTPAKPPVSADLDLDKIAELKAEYQPIKDCLLGVVDALKNLDLKAVDGRLLGEGEKAVAVMLKRLARCQISDEIGEKLLHMCGYINVYDFNSALAIQTALVHSDWRDHKDWLKGTKSLLQLCIKKFAQ